MAGGWESQTWKLEATPHGQYGAGLAFLTYRDQSGRWGDFPSGCSASESGVNSDSDLY